MKKLFRKWRKALRARRAAIGAFLEQHPHAALTILGTVLAAAGAAWYSKPLGLLVVGGACLFAAQRRGR